MCIYMNMSTDIYLTDSYDRPFTPHNARQPKANMLMYRHTNKQTCG